MWPTNLHVQNNCKTVETSLPLRFEKPWLKVWPRQTSLQLKLWRYFSTAEIIFFMVLLLLAMVSNRGWKSSPFFNVYLFICLFLFCSDQPLLLYQLNSGLLGDTLQIKGEEFLSFHARLCCLSS